MDDQGYYLKIYGVDGVCISSSVWAVKPCKESVALMIEKSLGIVQKSELNFLYKNGHAIIMCFFLNKKKEIEYTFRKAEFGKIA